MVILFAFFLFFGAAVELEKDKILLHPQEMLQVTLRGNYGEDETPQFFEFLEEIREQKRYGSFELSSYKILDEEPHHFHLELTLQPMKLGQLLFAPGLLALENGKAIQIPSFEIECQRLFQPLPFFPALPVRPEAAITLDEATRAVVQAENKQGTLTLLEQKERRGRAFTVLFFLLFVGILFFAGTIFFEWMRKRKPLVPRFQRNWKREFEEIRRVDALAAFLKDFYSEKMGVALQHKTAEELRGVFATNERLLALFSRLETAQFSGKPLSDSDLSELLSDAKKEINF